MTKQEYQTMRASIIARHAQALEALELVYKLCNDEATNGVHGKRLPHGTSKAIIAEIWPKLPETFTTVDVRELAKEIGFTGEQTNLLTELERNWAVDVIDRGQRRVRPMTYRKRQTEAKPCEQSA